MKIEVIEAGEWKPAGKYIMGRWQKERHGDNARHPNKFHLVHRMRDFRAKFMAEKQLARIAEQREARNGNSGKEQGQKGLAAKAIHAGSPVQVSPTEYGAGHLDV